MLVYLYLFALIVGGVVLGASLLLGGQDADADAGVDADGAEVGLDADTDAAGAGTGVDLFWAFRSIRFWTFFLAFFGLTGLVLDGLGLTGTWSALALALAVGFGTGFGATAAMRFLSRDTSGSTAGADDYLGKSVRVLVPVERNGTGKVRLQLKGSTVDVLATTDEQRGFTPREQAMIVEMNGTTARIARVDTKGEE